MVDFALTQPGLFRTVFHHGAQTKTLGDPNPNDPDDPDDPHLMLVERLDELVRLGVLSETQRRDAEMRA